MGKKRPRSNSNSSSSNRTTFSSSHAKAAYKRATKYEQQQLYQYTFKEPHHACGHHDGACSLDNPNCACAKVFQYRTILLQ
jgi:hypothetical protein